MGLFSHPNLNEKRSGLRWADDALISRSYIYDPLQKLNNTLQAQQVCRVVKNMSKTRIILVLLLGLPILEIALLSYFPNTTNLYHDGAEPRIPNPATSPQQLNYTVSQNFSTYTGFYRTGSGQIGYIIGDYPDSGKIWVNACATRTFWDHECEEASEVLRFWYTINNEETLMVENVVQQSHSAEEYSAFKTKWDYYLPNSSQKPTEFNRLLDWSSIIVDKAEGNQTFTYVEEDTLEYGGISKSCYVYQNTYVSNTYH